MFTLAQSSLRFTASGNCPGPLQSWEQRTLKQRYLLVPGQGQGAYSRVPVILRLTVGLHLGPHGPFQLGKTEATHSTVSLTQTFMHPLPVLEGTNQSLEPPQQLDFQDFGKLR